jgi:selenocysteine-specific elongation factor
VPASDSESHVSESRESVVNFINQILERVEIPDRSLGTQKPFMFSIDHCF